MLARGVRGLKRRPLHPLRKMSTQAPLVMKPVAEQTGVCIFLHGLGDSGYGWEDAAQFFQSKLPGIKFILPHAPSRPVTLNMGMKMPAWYDIRHLNPDAREDVDGLNDTRRIIAELVDAEIKAGTPSDKIILGGFSQGGASAIWSGFSESRKLAGILGLSCYVPSAKTFPEIVREENKSTPILMLHGDSDEVVRYSWGQQSFALLKELGLNGTFKAYKGMGHSASMEELVDITAFLSERIGSK